MKITKPKIDINTHQLFYAFKSSLCNKFIPYVNVCSHISFLPKIEKHQAQDPKLSLVKKINTLHCLAQIFTSTCKLIDSLHHMNIYRE